MDTRQKKLLPMVIVGACVAMTVIAFFDEPAALIGVFLAIVLLGLTTLTPPEDEKPHKKVPTLLITLLATMLLAVLVSAKLDASIKSAPRPAQSQSPS